MSLLKTLAATAAAMLVAGTAHAATLGLVQNPEPQVIDTAAEILRDGDEFTIFSSPGTETVGFPTTFPPFFTISANVDAEGAVGPFGGSLLLSDFDSLDVTGTLVAFGSVFNAGGEDRLEFLFEQDSGNPELGPRILAIFTGEFDDILTDPFSSTTGAATIAPVIPLPAGILLLGSAVGMLVLRRLSFRDHGDRSVA